MNLDKCSTHRAGIPRSATIANHILTDDRAATIAGRPAVFADTVPHILAGTTYSSQLSRDSLPARRHRHTPGCIPLRRAKYAIAYRMGHSTRSR